MKFKFAAAAGGLAGLLLLAGCAGAKVTPGASAPATSPTPFEILVDVVPAVQDATQAEFARQVSAKLNSDLVERLARQRITAEPFVAGTSHPGAVVLRVAIVDADPGNRLERMAIGFGLGKAELQAKASLASSDDATATALTAFDTESDTGHKPGLILPGGVALATRNIVHLAVGGGIGVATQLHDGTDKPIKETASAIVDQLKSYYSAAGWIWPANM